MRRTMKEHSFSEAMFLHGAAHRMHERINKYLSDFRRDQVCVVVLVLSKKVANGGFCGSEIWGDAILRDHDENVHSAKSDRQIFRKNSCSPSTFIVWSASSNDLSQVHRVSVHIIQCIILGS